MLDDYNKLRRGNLIVYQNKFQTSLQRKRAEYTSEGGMFYDARAH